MGQIDDNELIFHVVVSNDRSSCLLHSIALGKQVRKLLSFQEFVFSVTTSPALAPRRNSNAREEFRVHKQL